MEMRRMENNILSEVDTVQEKSNRHYRELKGEVKEIQPGKWDHTVVGHTDGPAGKGVDGVKAESILREQRVKIRSDYLMKK